MAFFFFFKRYNTPFSPQESRGNGHFLPFFSPPLPLYVGRKRPPLSPSPLPFSPWNLQTGVTPFLFYRSPFPILDRAAALLSTPPPQGSHRGGATKVFSLLPFFPCFPSPEFDERNLPPPLLPVGEGEFDFSFLARVSFFLHFGGQTASTFLSSLPPSLCLSASSRADLVFLLALVFPSLFPDEYGGVLFFLSLDVD